MFALTPFVRGTGYFTAYDPWKEMEELESRLFGRQLPAFKTDVRETDTAYVLEAELPGFAKEDIHAEIKDGILTIRAERNRVTEEKDDTNHYVRRERSYGSFQRSFNLEGIRIDDISAAYKSGVLTVNLPKEEQKKPEGRTLEIQ